MPICYGTHAAMRWPMPATTHDPCRLISGTRISSIRCAIPSCRRLDSRISGGASDPLRFAELLQQPTIMSEPWQPKSAVGPKGDEVRPITVALLIPQLLNATIDQGRWTVCVAIGL